MADSPLQWLLFVLLPVFLPYCYYDATPPDLENKTQSSPTTITVAGAPSLSAVSLQWWDSSGFHVSGEPLGLSTEVSGRLVYTIYTDADSSLGFIVFSDTSGDGLWGAEDRGYIRGDHRPTTSIRIAYSRFSDTLEAQPDPDAPWPSGTNICVFSPKVSLKWNGSGTIEYFKRKEKPIPIIDWPMISIWSVTETENGPVLDVSRSAYLISNFAYSAFCFVDDNRDSEWNSGENAYKFQIATMNDASNPPVYFSLNYDE